MLSIACYIAVVKKILSQKPKELEKFLYVSFLKNTFRKDTYQNYSPKVFYKAEMEKSAV